MSDSSIRETLVSLDLPAASVLDVVQHAATMIAEVSGVAASTLESALHAAVQGHGFSIGSGVAVPHAVVDALSETFVVTVRTKMPLAVAAVDGQSIDLFFVILSRPDDARGHLLLLARIARLTQSRVFLEGLRRASSAAGVVALVEAAEARHTPAIKAAELVDGGHALVVVTVAGERTVDALLVELLDRDLGEASILEAQSVREAVTNEVPLFAGFRDIFGDPGGQRVIVLTVGVGRVNELMDIVRRVIEERPPRQARIMVLPVAQVWGVEYAERESERGHH